MEKSSNHLCELLSPCCLELISKSVVTEILKVFISILFFSIIIEIISSILFSIIVYFYPSLCNKETEIVLPLQESNENNIKENSSKKSNVINSLFSNIQTIPSYNFDFDT